MLFHKRDFTSLLILALPLIVSGMVESSLSFTSTMFLGRLSPEILAAGSLVSWFFATMMIIMWGMFGAVSVLISHHNGAREHDNIAYVIRDATWISLVISIPISVLIWNMAPVLVLLGQKQEVVTLAIPYLHALSYSMFPDFFGLVLLQVLIGLEHTRTNMFVSLGWVPFNIFVNWVFVFGHLGAQPLGLAGLGWGTTITYWSTTGLIFGFMLCRQCYRRYFWALLTFSRPKFVWELIKVGVPMGAMWLIEICCFFSITLLIGHIGVYQLAANQVAMQFLGFFTSLTFSMAQAITIRMGNKIGAKRFDQARRAAYAGITIAFSMIFVLACVMWFKPDWLLAIDFGIGHMQHPEVARYTELFLLFCGVFMLLESVRLALFGALRGMKDTHFSLVTSIVQFWAVGLCAGAIIQYHWHLGAVSYWWGLAFSPVVGIIMLSWRFKTLSASLMPDKINPRQR